MENAIYAQFVGLVKKALQYQLKLPSSQTTKSHAGQAGPEMKKCCLWGKNKNKILLFHAHSTGFHQFLSKENNGDMRNWIPALVKLN